MHQSLMFMSFIYAYICTEGSINSSIVPSRPSYSLTPSVRSGLRRPHGGSANRLTPPHVSRSPRFTPECFSFSVEAQESEFLSVLQYMNFDTQNVDRGGLYFDPSDYRRTQREVSGHPPTVSTSSIKKRS